MTNTADQTNVADLSALADELSIVRHAVPPASQLHRRGRWAAVHEALADSDAGEWIAVERLANVDSIHCQSSALFINRRAGHPIETRRQHQPDGTVTLWLRIKP